MNKIIPVVIIAFVASTVGAWYFATHKPRTCTLITDSDTLIVGTNAEYAPFSFMKDDTISGFDIDLIHEIAKRLHKKIDLTDMTFDALIPAMQVGSIHVIAAGITSTAERAQRMLFTKPYVTGDPLLIISSIKKPIASIDELTGKRVGVNEGYTADFYLSNIKGPELVRLSSPVDLFLALQSNQIDALVAAGNTVQPFLKQLGSASFHIVPIEGTSDHYSLGITKKCPELLEPIQKALDEMEADGTIAALKEKWELR